MTDWDKLMADALADTAQEATPDELDALLREQDIRYQNAPKPTVTPEQLSGLKARIKPPSENPPYLLRAFHATRDAWDGLLKPKSEFVGAGWDGHDMGWYGGEHYVTTSPKAVDFFAGGELKPQNHAVYAFDLNPEEFYDVTKGFNNQSPLVQQAIYDDLRTNPYTFFDPRGESDIGKWGMKDPRYNDFMENLHKYGVKGLVEYEDSMGVSNAPNYVYRYADDVPIGIDTNKFTDIFPEASQPDLDFNVREPQIKDSLANRARKAKPLLAPVAKQAGRGIARGAVSTVARGLGYLIPGVNAVLTAADIYEGLNSPVHAADFNTEQSYTLENYVPEYVQPLKGNDGNYVIQGGLTHQYFLPPTNRTDNSITPNNGAPMLPFIQLDDNGVPSSQLQGRVEENYMLPPQPSKKDDYYKKAKQFYGLMKTNPQVPFNVFNNFIQGDTKDLPGLLNGASAGANM